jgi:hypothetical protein
LKFIDDWDALTALFKCNQYRHDAQRRYDAAKRDLRDAKEIQAEILDRIDRHVGEREAAGARQAMIDSGTSAEGLRDLRTSLGMDEFGKKKGDDPPPIE